MSMSTSATDAQSLEGMSLAADSNSSVPPGFRFHPTDEELVGYYLTKKVACNKIDLDVIREIDLYKLEPWDLQERCRIGSAEQHEWYFFSHKDKKYPTGTRTNRATTAGFWKATGRDKPIFAKVKLIGMRKTLVFYKGRAPNGQKSDWIMHEYRLEDDINNTTANEEGWVVCRVFKKRSIVKKPHSDYEGLYCYDVDDSTDKLLLAASSSSFGNHHHGSSNSMSSNFVKQETEGGFYFPFPYDAFAQLPRLESPKRSCDNASGDQNNVVVSSNSNSSNSRAAVDFQQQQQQQQQVQELEELIHLAPKSILPLALQDEDHHFHGFHQEDLPASWGMDDKILTDLSQDEYTKDTRCGLTGHLVTEMPPFRRQQQQQQQLQQEHQQQQPEFSYDVDLWSFNR